MYRLREHSGIDYLSAVSRLLQRARIAHPTKGVWEAADLQWWWRKPRSTDSWPQPFWYDTGGPVAAAVATDWGTRVGLDILTLPTATAALVEEVWERGRVLVADSDCVEVMVDDDDVALATLLDRAGFEQLPDKGISAWMPAPSSTHHGTLPDGYSVLSRDVATVAHHFVDRVGVDVEDRLKQTSLYRPDLDLTVVDGAGNVVAYGLFWYDPVTRIGFVEPMGTDEAHRRRGLARCILNAGIDRLTQAGADRVKINYEATNPASSGLYLDVGFEPRMTTSLWTRGRHP